MLGGAFAGVGDEVLPEVLREERHHRADPAKALDERVPEHPEGRLVAVPEAPARTTDVPVGHVVHERIEALDKPMRQLLFEGLGGLDDVLLRSGDEPTVERPRTLLDRGASRSP